MSKTTEITDIPLEQFLQKYSDKEDGYKYEWNDGKIEKTASTNQSHLVIIRNLNRLFSGTKIYEDGGVLSANVNVKTSEKQLRRPDLAIFSNEQVVNFDDNDAMIPAWVAKIISPSDNIYRVEHKLIEYFNAGVQVVWHIFPDINKVYVYTAKGVTMCTDEMICSGFPALDDFEIAAKDIFAK